MYEGIINKINKYSLIVKQIIPNEKFDIDWNNNNLKSMKVSEMIKYPNIHNEFLKKNNRI